MRTEPGNGAVCVQTLGMRLCTCLRDSVCVEPILKLRGIILWFVFWMGMAISWVQVQELPLASWLERSSASSGGMAILLSKLHGCINQLEQFPVRVHDLPGRRYVHTHATLSRVYTWCAYI